MCHGHQRRTEGQQSPCLKEGSKEGWTQGEANKWGPGKVGKYREMDIGIQAAKPPSSASLVIYPASSQPFFPHFGFSKQLKSFSKGIRKITVNQSLQARFSLYLFHTFWYQKKTRRLRLRWHTKGLLLENYSWLGTDALMSLWAADNSIAWAIL